MGKVKGVCHTFKGYGLYSNINFCSRKSKLHTVKVFDNNAVSISTLENNPIQTSISKVATSHILFPKILTKVKLFNMFNAL